MWANISTYSSGSTNIAAILGGLFEFGLRCASIADRCGYSPSATPRQNSKNPRPKWLQYLLNRSG
jgi:hypothetical protein